MGSERNRLGVAYKESQMCLSAWGWWESCLIEADLVSWLMVCRWFGAEPARSLVFSSVVSHREKGWGRKHLLHHGAAQMCPLQVMSWPLNSGFNGIPVAGSRQQTPTAAGVVTACVGVKC